MSVKPPEGSSQYHPLTPAEEKAVEGLTFRAGEIDHTIQMLRDFIDSSFSTGSSSRISKLLNKIGLGAEARVVRSLQQERNQIGKMLDTLGYVAPLSSKGQAALPNDALEIQKLLTAKVAEKTTLQSTISALNTQKDALSKPYKDAIVFQAISTAGLGEIGPSNTQEIIDQMDKLNAQLKGIEHSLRKVDVEIRVLEDKSVTLIKNPEEQFTQAVENTKRRVTSRLTSIQAQIAQKTDLVERACFFARYPLKKELSLLQAQEAAAKVDIGRIGTLTQELFAKELQSHAAGVLATPPVDTGREAILTEMKNKPHQLAADLPRLGKIQIGEQLHGKEKYAGKSPMEIYEFIAKGIRGLVATPISPNTMQEVVYVVAQNFLGPLTTYAYNDTSILPLGDWAPLMERSSRNCIFKALDEKTVAITSNVTQVMQNVSEDRELQGKEKELTLQVECLYNLETNEATFKCKYILDGVTTEYMPTKSPFGQLEKKQ